MIKPTVLIAIEFSDGSVERMQYYGSDTSDEAINLEVNKNAVLVPITRWKRVSADYFPSSKTGWEKLGVDIIPKSATPPVKDKLSELTERIEALETRDKGTLK